MREEIDRAAAEVLGELFGESGKLPMDICHAAGVDTARFSNYRTNKTPVRFADACLLAEAMGSSLVAFSVRVTAKLKRSPF